MGAVKHGWALFKDNAGVMIGGTAIWFVGVGLVTILLNLLIIRPIFFRPSAAEQLLAGRGNMGAFVGVGIFAQLVVIAVGMVLAIAASSAVFSAALKLYDTGKVEISDFFTFRNLPQVILFSIVVGFASGLGAITGIISFAIGVFTFLGLPLIIDRNMGFWDAIMASAKYVASDFGQSILFVVLIGLVGALGVLLCGIGILATAPISVLALATFYRGLGQEPAEFKFA